MMTRVLGAVEARGTEATPCAIRAEISKVQAEAQQSSQAKAKGKAKSKGQAKSAPAEASKAPPARGASR